jgi:hypothetical protein
MRFCRVREPGEPPFAGDLVVRHLGPSNLNSPAEPDDVDEPLPIATLAFSRSLAKFYIAVLPSEELREYCVLVMTMFLVMGSPPTRIKSGELL